MIINQMEQAFHTIRCPTVHRYDTRRGGIPHFVRDRPPLMEKSDVGNTTKFELISMNG